MKMNQLPNQKKRKNGSPFFRQCFVTLSVCLNLMGHGCVVGFPAIMIPSLRLPESHIQVTPAQESWITSILGIALVFGNFIITPLVDIGGRKMAHLLTIPPVMVGWFLLLLADNVAGLVAARCLHGIALGMLSPLAMIIIGEMTDPKNRGAFLMSISLFITIGVLFCHSLGTYFSWQQSALICSCISFISCVFIFYSPESPSWLIYKGRMEEAREVFLWLRGDDEQQLDELDKTLAAQILICQSNSNGKTQTVGNKIKYFFRYTTKTIQKPEFYKPIVIMLFMYQIFQFSGLNIISVYTTDIIKKVVGPEANANMLMVALDVQRLFCNILAVYFIKTMKRRTLLFSTGAVCVLTYFGIAGYVYAKQTNILLYDGQWIPILLLAVYMFTLTVGMSSIPLTIAGEIFPLEYRGLGNGIGVLSLAFGFFLCLKCFPVLVISIGFPLTYCLYASVVTLGLIIIWFMLPETKDRTLQEIEDWFRGLSPGDLKSIEPLNDKTEV